MKKTKILYVCLGNICRSPAAEGIMQSMLEQEKMEVELDSAGTSAYHEGEPADHRMQAHASKRGYVLSSRSRPFNPSEDFESFDWIIAMDDANFDALIEMAPNPEAMNKVRKMAEFAIHRKDFDHIPDPYFGGAQGFELVIDLLEDMNRGLMEELKSKKS